MYWLTLMTVNFLLTCADLFIYSIDHNSVALTAAGFGVVGTLACIYGYRRS